MKKDLDKKLYNDYLNGEKQAFDFLYDKYRHRIEYFVFNIVKDYQKAEDIAQETFIYVMENKIREDISFKYYIYMIAKSRAVNYINTEKRRIEITEEYCSSNSESIEKDVLELITKEETRKEILEAIELLDEKYKNTIYLVKIEELSYEETAKILGQSIQNTKNLIHRGKKELRRILLKKGFDNMNKVSKVIFMILVIGIILSGVAYATNIIIKNFFGLNSSEGVNTAVNNGYIEKINTETIDANGIEFSIDSFLMDDFNFDMNFNVKLDNRYNIKDFMNLYIEDLRIIDENGNIVFSTNYKTTECFNEYSMFCTKKNNNELILSLTTSSSKKAFPKSKHLNISFTRIIDWEEYHNGNLNQVYVGSWDFETDVPKEFYNRESIIYKAKQCNETGIDISKIKAILSKTAFKISIPKISIPKISTDKVDYELLHQSTEKNKMAFQKEYVETSDGKKFEIAGKAETNGYELSEENEIINYFQTFDLTSFDATDKLKVHVFTNKGKEIIIDFEK